MSKLYSATFVVITGLMLVGCSDEKQPTPTTMSEDNVFKGQVDSLEKAKGVEATIQGDFDRQREHIDSQ